MTTFLIADDERIERNYLRKILEKNTDFLVVAEAENGKEAVSLCRLKSPDIVIMDINMPVESGLEAAAEIRDFLPEQIIILNTAYAEFPYANEAIRLSLNAYLLKPSDEKEILGTIDSCLRRKKITVSESASRFEGFSSNISYPYAEESDLLSAIKTLNLTAFDKARIKFIDRVSENTMCDEYRLYFINLIFSIERLLSQVGIDDSMIRVLKGTDTSLHIMQTTQNEKMLKLISDYIAQMSVVFNRTNEQLSYTDKAVFYIRNHYSEHISLSDLASYTHISESRLSHLFHDEKHCTIPKYINQIRVEAATKELEKGVLSIQEVAESCGFGSVASFYRVYKNYTGKLPAEIRRRGQKT